MMSLSDWASPEVGGWRVREYNELRVRGKFANKQTTQLYCKVRGLLIWGEDTQIKSGIVLAKWVVNTVEDEAHQEAREAQVEGPPVFRCHRDNRPWTVATDGSAKGAVGFGVVAVEDRSEGLGEEDPDLV